MTAAAGEINPCRDRQPIRASATILMSTFVKLFGKLRQVFRLFCQVFANIYLAILFSLNRLGRLNLLI
jgi:hypothetical protein